MAQDAVQIDSIPTGELLKLENQVCFPLYACSKEVVRRYTPFLDKLNRPSDLLFEDLPDVWQLPFSAVGHITDPLENHIEPCQRHKPADA